MTTITTVKFHQLFISGGMNFPTATDLPFMTDVEVNNLYGWISDILAGKSHVGANKPSWLTSNGDFRLGTEAYRDNNIWHYHCGPYRKNDDPPEQYTDNTLAENHLGRLSAPVYHYSKQNDTVIVLGYSRLHNPFPLPRSRKNPVPGRGYSLGQVVDFEP